MKRAADLTLAGVALLVVLPLLAILGVLIRLTSPGPVLFRQTRMGRDGVPFQCLKLRTMVPDAQVRLSTDADLRRRHRENGFKLPTGSDPRVTGLGGFLRRWHLDELPQLWNVVRGDISLVGPRPIEPDQYEAWLEADPEAWEVLTVPPGVFGAWTAQGRSRVDEPERIRVEISYTRRWSVWSDAIILVRHLPVLLRGQEDRAS